MVGGLFIIHGLIATVEGRIAPLVPTFMDYLTCSMRMENSDAMGTRLACGLISDLANSIGADIVQWLPQIMDCLLRVLIDNAFDSDAKLVAIIAFGDVTLAAGSENFLKYLP